MSRDLHQWRVPYPLSERDLLDPLELPDGRRRAWGGSFNVEGVGDVEASEPGFGAAGPVDEGERSGESGEDCGGSAGAGDFGSSSC